MNELFQPLKNTVSSYSLMLDVSCTCDFLFVYLDALHWTAKDKAASGQKTWELFQTFSKYHTVN